MTTITLSIVEAFANSSSTFTEALRLAEADLAAVIAEPPAQEADGLIEHPIVTYETSTSEK